MMISLEAERSTTPAFFATTHTPESTAAFAAIPVPTTGALGGQKRYRLTLHVRSHQSTVRIVVLEERNHGSSYGEYHLRGYVHQVDFLLLELGSLLTETTRYVIVDEVSFFV